MDVTLFNTADGGEIEIINGVVSLSGGLATAVYLSLFGGNEQDAGLSDTTKSWWGNASETDSAYHYRSRVQYLLRSIPATSGNLRRIEDAVRKDLDWMISKKIVSSIDVSASIPGLNRIRITVIINGDETVEFLENWKVDI